MANYNGPKYHSDTYRSIEISYHARLRASQRLGTEKIQEIQKLAYAARTKGIKVWLLGDKNKEQNKNRNRNQMLDEETYHLLKNKLRINGYNKHTPYYYKDNIYLFHGKHVLITIIPLEVLKTQ